VSGHRKQKEQQHPLSGNVSPSGFTMDLHTFRSVMTTLMNGLTRRNLLRLGSLAATACLCWHFEFAMAGPFKNAGSDKLDPADKKPN